MRQPYRILLVDDDALLVASLARAATDAGLVTSIALDPLRAVELCKAEPPDLILLDVNMPAADGRDILKALKADQATAKIPVFIHSSRSEHYDRLVALELGADDYIEKPFDTNLLFRRIVSAIEKARAGDST